MRFCALSARAFSACSSAGCCGGAAVVLMLTIGVLLVRGTAPGPPYRGPVTGPERWIDLCDPDDAALEAALSVEVHETALARLRAPPRHDDEPRPRLETHGNYSFGVRVLSTIDDDAD